MWVRDTAFSAPLCRMVEVVLLKLSFVFTSQGQATWGVHYADLTLQSEGKKVASKKQGRNPVANPMRSVKKKVIEIKLMYNKIHRS